MSFQQRRTIRDDKRMNFYDRLQLEMQKERTRINSAPIIKKRDLKGTINHEKPPITTKKTQLSYIFFEPFSGPN